MPSPPGTALVTGASSGIGQRLARLIAADGYDLVLVARRSDLLDRLASEITGAHRVAVTTRAVDLSHPDGASALLDQLDAERITIDLLVNNAGFGLRGAFADLPLDRQLEMVALNVTALTLLTRRLVPGMRERNRGGVLNVGSTAAFQPGPFMAVYYATKAYVVSFSEALAEELSGTNVRVSCLAPGPTSTDFAATARATDTDLFKGRMMDSASVAREGYEGWKAGRVLVVPGRHNRLRALAVRLLPRAVVRKVARGLNE
jgi:short-subunit dehydrogenase